MASPQFHKFFLFTCSVSCVRYLSGFETEMCGYLCRIGLQSSFTFQFGIYCTSVVRCRYSLKLHTHLEVVQHGGSKRNRHLLPKLKCQECGGCQPHTSPKHHQLLGLMWMDHWGGVLTRSPFISQQLPLRTFQHRQKLQTVAGLRWDRQQLSEREAGRRANRPLVKIRRHLKSQTLSFLSLDKAEEIDIWYSQE